jgi:archaeal flagellar protein FlaJ
MPLSDYQKFAYNIKFFRDWGLKQSKSNPNFNLLLEKANYDIRAEIYYAATLCTAVLSALGWFGFCLLLIFFLLPYMQTHPPNLPEIPIIIDIAVFLLAPLVSVVVYFALLWWPTSVASERSKNIDKNLNYAVNYMAAMASANVTPTAIFQGLSKQDIYGEIQNESAKVARDIDFFGKDLLKCLQRAMNRTPSIRFQDFLQGIITTSNSGGSLKSYFMAKSDQYLKESRVEQKKTLQTLAVLAESYITVVVASPLFLIVMMSVMGMMGNASGITFLWLIVLLVIPCGQVLFIFILSQIKTE